MDHGYPQITAINILTSYIKVASVKDLSQVGCLVCACVCVCVCVCMCVCMCTRVCVHVCIHTPYIIIHTQMKEPPPAQLTNKITGAVDWRQAGKYKYRKNEVFIDVLESVNLLMSVKGEIFIMYTAHHTTHICACVY